MAKQQRPDPAVRDDGYIAMTICRRSEHPIDGFRNAVRLVDRLVAQQVGVDLVLGMRLAGVPLRSDRRESRLV
jgi:hypothetical protein